MITLETILQLVKNLMRVLLGAIMILAGKSHLTTQRQEFQSLVPSWLTQDTNIMDFIVVASGIIEIALGLAMIILYQHKGVIGIALAIFFIIVFPGNLSQYLDGIDAFGLDTDQKRLTRLFFQPVLILWALWSTGGIKLLTNTTPKVNRKGFYGFEAKLINGENILMEQFKGKTIIVVNTASKCGLTPQYQGLESLYQKYKDKGLVILGFPCNQFGNQEDGSASEIEAFCTINYGVSFPMFDKVEVNGKNTHPIFNYLKTQLGQFFSDTIKWNFTKFVINKNGKPVKRFSPKTTPEEMTGFIEKII
jgi:glutathione peroxidase-family protein/uncharacterized membrane protein